MQQESPCGKTGVFSYFQRGKVVALLACNNAQRMRWASSFANVGEPAPPVRVCDLRCAAVEHINNKQGLAYWLKL